jgi:hypothetical protein
MQILYIIGNGFDLSLGLKTSYKDFYDHYKSLESQSSYVNKLKKNISNNYKNWSDLELALGQYTNELNSLEDFDEVFEDIGDNLASYLSNEENTLDISKFDNAKFFDHLTKPENSLLPADRNKINLYKAKFSNNQWDINIITFNYTRTLEKIIGKNQDSRIGVQANRNAIVLRRVEHIHGYTDKSMVMGVNDLSQVKNKSFHGNQDILEALIKVKCNEAIRLGIDDFFKSKIQSASLICIFGSSIGDTDNIWWELIGKRLKAEIPIILFTKGEEVIDPRIGYKNNRTERKMRNYFLKKTNLSEEIIPRIENNVFVGLDTPMFKNILR